VATEELPGARLTACHWGRASPGFGLQGPELARGRALVNVRAPVELAPRVHLPPPLLRRPPDGPARDARAAEHVISGPERNTLCSEFA
jgi:hypothetical protein